MIKSAKEMEKMRKGISAVGVVYLSLVGSPFVLYSFPLDYREDNLVIFVIKSLSLSRTNSPLLRIYFFET